MKTVTVKEASRNLSDVLRSAADGEEVIINDGMFNFSVHLVCTTSKPPRQGRAALQKLQAESRLTPAQAENYLREVHAERLAHENGNGE